MVPSNSPTEPGFSVGIADAAGAGVVVTVTGELDLSTAPRLREAIEEALDGGRDVAVDLGGCSFIDSSGIAVLAGIAWRLKSEGRAVEIRGINERIRYIFELSGLASLDALVLEPRPGS